MSHYTPSDFEESIKEIAKDSILRVIAAWGNVDSQGQCCDECGGEWKGGFLMSLKDGRYAYVTGWCDYTGWGCQDGVSTAYYSEKPELDKLSDIPILAWDIEPSDLNLFLERRFNER